MKCQVLGIQPVDYVSRKTGKQVTGTTLHVAYEIRGVEGLCTETVFISEKSNIDLSNVGIDSMVGLNYNRWGSVESLEVI